MGWRGLVRPVYKLGFPVGWKELSHQSVTYLVGGLKKGLFFSFTYLENVVTSDCGLIPETSYFPNRLPGKGMSKRSGWGRVALDAVVQGFH